MREKWTDYEGKQWPVSHSPRPLKFRIPSHAALRRHVFHRDGYSCVRCEAKALHIPDGWDGTYTLKTNTNVCGGAGSEDILILDHIKSRRNGGRNVVGNLQTLCETCNKRKCLQEDRKEYREMCG